MVFRFASLHCSVQKKKNHESFALYLIAYKFCVIKKFLLRFWPDLQFSKSYKLLNDKCYNLDSKSSYTSGRHLFSLLLLVYLEFSLIVFWTEK